MLASVFMVASSFWLVVVTIKLDATVVPRFTEKCMHGLNGTPDSHCGYCRAGLTKNGEQSGYFCTLVVAILFMAALAIVR